MFDTVRSCAYLRQQHKCIKYKLKINDGQSKALGVI